jgi:hypothetical protein
MKLDDDSSTGRPKSRRVRAHGCRRYLPDPRYADEALVAHDVAHPSIRHDPEEEKAPLSGAFPRWPREESNLRARIRSPSLFR